MEVHDAIESCPDPLREPDQPTKCRDSLACIFDEKSSPDKVGLAVNAERCRLEEHFGGLHTLRLQRHEDHDWK